MIVRSLLEVLDAAHLSKFVQSPFTTRGGILLIGPPETLRTTMVDHAYQDYPDALSLADLNTRQLIQIREDMAAGKITTLAFTEFAKIYMRNPQVAMNVEGHIMAMVEEGFSLTTATDSRMSSIKARALVIAACSEKFYQSRFTQWTDSGFSRRFLHSMYILDNPWQLVDAQEKRMLIELGTVKRKIPGNRIIRFNLSDYEMQAIRRSLKWQFRKGMSTPFHLAANIYNVLKWKHDEKTAKEIWEDFAESLQESGARLHLPPLELKAVSK